MSRRKNLEIRKKYKFAGDGVAIEASKVDEKKFVAAMEARIDASLKWLNEGLALERWGSKTKPRKQKTRKQKKRIK